MPRFALWCRRALSRARCALRAVNCLLLDGQGTMRANCVAIDLKSQGALLLSTPFAEIPLAPTPAA